MIRQTLVKTRLLLLWPIVVLLQSCGLGQVEVNTEFSSDTDVIVGLQVFHQDERVGEVTELATKDGKVLVKLAIDKSAAANIDHRSAVLVNRLRPGAPLEIISRNQQEFESLADRQSLVGLDSIFQVGAWMLGDLSEIQSGSISDYLDAFNGYLKSERFDRDAEIMRREFEVLKQSATQTLSAIETELERTAGKIEESEQALSEALGELGELGEELSPSMDELAALGSQVLEEIEAFTESMKSMSAEEQQTAQQLLERLEQSLERINQRINTKQSSIEE